MSFKIINKDLLSNARTGELKLKRLTVKTPFFMPVCTNATPKAVTFEVLNNIGYEMIVSNAYHLFLRPGSEFIKKNFTNLHRFCGWEKGILTDSGGFQIWSLGSLVKIESDGVIIKSHIDGKLNKLSPELSIQIQEDLGSDIMMIFDDCPKPDVDYSHLLSSINRTKVWAEKSKKIKKTENLIFGIVQGGIYKSLRKISAKHMIDLDFDGIAIGGLGLGEGAQKTYEITNDVCEILPLNKPRYSMGIGKPEDILESVSSGVDIFDCVVPTRNARNGTVFTFNGKINIKNSKNLSKNYPFDENCDCKACKNYSIGYIRHLYNCNEMSAIQLMTECNLYFYNKLIEYIRFSIDNGTFIEYKKNFYERYFNE